MWGVPFYLGGGLTLPPNKHLKKYAFPKYFDRPGLIWHGWAVKKLPMGQFFRGFHWVANFPGGITMLPTHNKWQHVRDFPQKIGNLFCDMEKSYWLAPRLQPEQTCQFSTTGGPSAKECESCAVQINGFAQCAQFQKIQNRHFSLQKQKIRKMCTMCTFHFQVNCLSAFCQIKPPTPPARIK